MDSESKPFSRLGIEVVLGQMNIQKLWKIRKENEVLRSISDRIPFKETRKWKIRSIVIKENSISSPFNPNPHFTKLEGIKQTKWISPQILSLIDSNSDIIQKSLLPVSATFCRSIKAIEIQSDKTESEEYIQSVFKLIERSSKIIALSFHSPNVTEFQLFEVLKSFNLKENPKESLRISLNSSTELTPKFIKEFCLIDGILNDRMISIKKKEEGERETPKRQAILQFFMDYENDIDGKMARRGIIIEEMDREIAHSIVFDLQRIYENGKMFYENGSLAFYLGRPAHCIQFEVGRLINNQ